MPGRRKNKKVEFSLADGEMGTIKRVTFVSTTANANTIPWDDFLKWREVVTEPLIVAHQKALYAMDYAQAEQRMAAHMAEARKKYEDSLKEQRAKARDIWQPWMPPGIDEWLDVG